jgi:hypothetical protein
MTLKVMAQPIEARYLKPGDLYSEHGPEYWQRMLKSKAFAGVPLFLCVDTPVDDDSLVYRIEAEVEGQPKKIEELAISHTLFSPLMPPGAKPR